MPLQPTKMGDQEHDLDHKKEMNEMMVDPSRTPLDQMNALVDSTPRPSRTNPEMSTSPLWSPGTGATSGHQGTPGSGSLITPSRTNNRFVYMEESTGPTVMADLVSPFIAVSPGTLFPADLSRPGSPRTMVNWQERVALRRKQSQGGLELDGSASHVKRKLRTMWSDEEPETKPTAPLEIEIPMKKIKTKKASAQKKLAGTGASVSPVSLYAKPVAWKEGMGWNENEVNLNETSASDSDTGSEKMTA